MKSAVFATIAVGALALAISASAGTNRFQASGFDKIAVSDHVTVIYREGPFSVVAEEPNYRFDDLRIEVEGRTLEVGQKPERYLGLGWLLEMGEPRPRFTVTVTAPALTGVSVYDHGRFEGAVAGEEVRVAAWDHGRFTGAIAGADVSIRATDHGRVSGDAAADNLSLHAGDHGRYEGEVSADTLNVRAWDHGGVSSDGRCGALSVDANDHGRFEGGRLRCDSATVQASDRASVDVWTDGAFEGAARSNARVTVRGAPQMRRVTLSDNGRVDAL